jgi:predicted O-methyltransferase YrrM
MRDLRGLIKKDSYDQGGWCLDGKRNLIHNLVKTTLSKNCIEIGVYKGSSLFSFAEVLEEIGGKIVGIDPWSFEMSKNEIPLFDKNQEDYFYNELLKGQETFEFIYKGVCEIIENNDLSKTVSLIRKPSQDVFNNFKNESIDIVHIDGNHNEMNASRDILLYLPLVKKGGYIIMDDSNWDSVRNSINKFLIPHCDLVENIGYCSYYVKK